MWSRERSRDEGAVVRSRETNFSQGSDSDWNVTMVVMYGTEDVDTCYWRSCHGVVGGCWLQLPPPLQVIVVDSIELLVHICFWRWCDCPGLPLLCCACHWHARGCAWVDDVGTLQDVYWNGTQESATKGITKATRTLKADLGKLEKHICFPFKAQLLNNCYVIWEIQCLLSYSWGI